MRYSLDCKPDKTDCRLVGIADNVTGDISEPTVCEEDTVNVVAFTTSVT